MCDKAESRIIIDNRGFLRVDGIPVCMVYTGGVLVFADKDKARAKARGTRYVKVTIEQLKELIDGMPNT